MATPENRDELVTQFMSVTGVDQERALFYLESSNWDVGLAMSSFYDNDGAEQQDETMADATEAKSEAASEARAKAVVANAAVRSGNVNTLGSIRAGEEDDDSEDSEEEGQAFFAGGSEHSGQQILGPPKKKKGGDFVSEMFRRARASGAEVSEAGASGSRGGAAGVAFTGAAFRLGSDVVQSERVGPSADELAANREREREFTLRMWANGFTVDDSELRPYTDPSNEKFLKSIMVGKIPDELIKEARGGVVNVNMEDRKTEDYVRPKATSKPFQGTGHMLGSVVPPMASAAAASATASNPEQKTADEDAARGRFPVDSSRPSASINIRLLDGSRLEVRLNEDCTVANLREYICLARPEYASATFALLTSYPSKELSNDSRTLKEEQVANSTILIRRK